MHRCIRRFWVYRCCFPWIFGVVALGVHSVVSLGVTGKVFIWVPGYASLCIAIVVDPVISGVFPLGFSICVPGKVLF